MMPIFEVSAKTGGGMAQWLDFLVEKLRALRAETVKA
jgi:Ni2+-binding GTPase involved in maturation of urease and hydrogenase